MLKYRKTEVVKETVVKEEVVVMIKEEEATGDLVILETEAVEEAMTVHQNQDVLVLILNPVNQIRQDQDVLIQNLKQVHLIHQDQDAADDNKPSC